MTFEFVKGNTVEAIVKLNYSKPSLIDAKEKISYQKTYRKAFEYFRSNLDKLNSNEKAILYRILGVLANSQSSSESALLESLENDFCDNIFEHDLHTIFNFSMGAQLNQPNTSIQFYCKAADYVYRNLMMNTKYLYVDLKATKLTTKKLNVQETDFLNFLGKEYKHIKVCYFNFS